MAENQWITIAEAARELGVSQGVMRSLLHKSAFRYHHKTGGRYYLLAEEIASYKPAQEHPVDFTLAAKLRTKYRTKSLPQQIQRARLALGLKREDVASIARCGVIQVIHAEKLQAIERGSVSLTVVKRICKAVGRRLVLTSAPLYR